MKFLTDSVCPHVTLPEYVAKHLHDAETEPSHLGTTCHLAAHWWVTVNSMVFDFSFKILNPCGFYFQVLPYMGSMESDTAERTNHCLHTARCCRTEGTGRPWYPTWKRRYTILSRNTVSGTELLIPWVTSDIHTNNWSQIADSSG